MSRARFKSKLMQASTVYRMTVYRHQTLDPIELVVSCGHDRGLCKWLKVYRLCAL